jgi:hypothetical protein
MILLGVDTDHSGLYGDTSSYYGTVEQQGHLTLGSSHFGFAMLLYIWIRGPQTSQEI